MLLFARDKYPLLEGIRRKIFDRNENYILMITGAPQTGKSSTAVKLAHVWAHEMGLDPTYKLSERWSLADAKRFLEIHQKKLKRGAVTVLDEGGVGIDNRKWYDIVVQSVNYLIQTYGHEGLFTIITSPTFDIDVKIKKLIKGLLVLMNKHENYVEGMFYSIQYNQKNDKIYYKRPRIVDLGGGTSTLFKIKFYKPEKELLEEYDNFQKPLKFQLKQQLLEKIIYEEQKKKARMINIYELRDKILENPGKFTKFHGGEEVWDKYKISMEFGIGITNSNKLISVLPSVSDLNGFEFEKVEKEKKRKKYKIRN